MKITIPYYVFVKTTNNKYDACYTDPCKAGTVAERTAEKTKNPEQTGDKVLY